MRQERKGFFLRVISCPFVVSSCSVSAFPPMPGPSPAALAKHFRALGACTRCPRMFRPVVQGRPVASKVILVGQAPGDKEPKLGRPFAWTAGKTLFKWLHGALGWTEDETRDR